MTTLLTFIIIYLISDKLSDYTLPINYNKYNDLAIKLHLYNGKFKSILTKLYYFKLFTCKSCNVFWISLILHSIITPEYIIYSLLTFLIHKVEGGKHV